MSPNKSLQKVQKVRKDEKIRETKMCKYPFNLTSFLMDFKRFDIFIESFPYKTCWITLIFVCGQKIGFWTSVFH